jgi:uncharacterized protein YndB with AHSA1/START domain
MTILFIILSVLIGLILLLLIIALFYKKAYTIQREIIINQPIEIVFIYLKHLKNQEQFSKWVMTDPAMKKIFTGTDGQIGFIYSWDSQNKQAGAGEQEIIAIDLNKRIDIEVRFLRPFVGIANTPFITEAMASNKTKVIWGMSSQMKYPLNIMLLVLDFETKLGNDIEISLNNLKTILEKPNV